jgi:hypothetical protein
MNAPLSEDKQRIKLYLLLRLISEHEKVSEYLSLPCPHGTCDECAREHYLKNGFVSGTEVA